MVRRVAGQPPDESGYHPGYSGDGGPAVDALISQPADVTLGDDGTLYFSDLGNHCIRAVDPGGIIRTVAGRCSEEGFEGDGGPGNQRASPSSTGR